LLKNKKLKLIDQHTGSFILENKLVETYLNFALHECTGVAINSQRYQFKHYINDSVQFKQSVHLFSGASLFCLNSFLLSLSILTSPKNKFRELLILNPIKGGFRCYCLGMFGFLAKAHGVSFFNSSFKTSFNLARDTTSTLQLFHQAIKFQQNFVFRFPFDNGNLLYTPRVLKRTFSFQKKFRLQHESLEKLSFSFHYTRVKKK